MVPLSWLIFSLTTSKPPCGRKCRSLHLAVEKPGKNRELEDFFIPQGRPFIEEALFHSCLLTRLGSMPAPSSTISRTMLPSFW